MQGLRSGLILTGSGSNLSGQTWSSSMIFSSLDPGTGYWNWIKIWIWIQKYIKTWSGSRSREILKSDLIRIWAKTRDPELDPKPCRHKAIALYSLPFTIFDYSKTNQDVFLGSKSKNTYLNLDICSFRSNDPYLILLNIIKRVDYTASLEQYTFLLKTFYFKFFPDKICPVVCSFWRGGVNFSPVTTGILKNGCKKCKVRSKRLTGVMAAP